MLGMLATLTLAGLLLDPAPARATHVPITAVSGGAFGYWSDGVSLFGGPQPDRGPAPTVTLAADASNSPASATMACAGVLYGPAALFTSDDIAVSTSGSLGPGGSATTTSSIDNINKAADSNCQFDANGDGTPETLVTTATGSEIFTATNLSGTATANGSGVTGTTTVTGGVVDVHSNSFNCSSLSATCGGHTHPADNTDTPLDESLGQVPVATNPTVNLIVEGHVHLCDSGPDCLDVYVIVFNERTIGSDGSITVNPVHEYFGYDAVPNSNGAYVDASGAKYNLVELPPYASGGPILHGHLYLGQVRAAVTPTGTNHAPDAVNDSYSTAEGTPLTVEDPGVLGNDTDPEGNALTAGSATDPPNGSVTLNADGSFTYTPDANFSGSDSFTYTASDGSGGTDTATVTITVTAAAASADLAVSIADLPAAVNPRSELSVAITVRNDGPDSAQATLLVTPTRGIRFLGAQGASCTVQKGRVKALSCNLGNMASGAQTTVTLLVKNPSKPQTATLAAMVSSPTVDPLLTNNMASESYAIQRP